MAENREGSRGDGPQIGVEHPKPQPDNENITTTPEETGVAPSASASEQEASGAMANTGFELPGQAPEAPASSVEPNEHMDGTIGPSIESEPFVAKAAESSRDEAAVNGGQAPSKRSPTALAEIARMQAERDAQRPTAAPQAGGNRARKVLVGVLVALTCIGMLSSALTFWMNQTILNTDRWIELVGPVAQNPQVVSAVSAYAADQTVELLNVQQRVQTALPDRADFLVVPITRQVHDFIQTRVAQGMNTPEFQRAWIAVNTALHKQIVAALRGDSQYATISNGTLTLDLVPLIGQALHQIQDQGPGIVAQRVTIPDLSQAQSPAQARQELSQALGVTIPDNFGQVVVVQSDQLAVAQQVVKILDILVIALPLLTLALLVATLWLSVNRRRTLIELGIGVVVVFVALRILIAYLQQMVIDSIKAPVAHGVGEGVIPTALDSLVAITTWIFAIGFVVALVAYLAGRRQREWISASYEEVRGR